MNLEKILKRKRPHGGRGEKALARYLAKAYNGTIDDTGNVTIGDGQICFCAHLDTADSAEGIRSLGHMDGMLWAHNDLLGADDGAGVYALSRMVEAGVEARYVFFVGEECGGIGSSRYDMPGYVDAVIALDRRGTTEVIHTQGGYPCASGRCSRWVAAHLTGYAPSDRGSFTDSRNFADRVPECLNIAVGYQLEHSTHEWLDVEHLERLIQELIGIPWQGMPICRQPVPEYPWFRRGLLEGSMKD